VGDFLSALTGLCAGLVMGGTVCAFFVALGVFSKLAVCAHYKTTGMEMAASSAAGSVLGCFVTIFRVSFGAGRGTTAFFGLFAGIYIGVFIACLAEVANMLPVLKNNGLTERVISFILLGFVLGKLVGSLVYWLSGEF
jgi:stage V sporulation protein AB